MRIRKIKSNYNPEKIDVGIIHIGLGAFVRAHLAAYTEQALNRQTGDWGICAANIRSNRKIVNTLNQQNGQYSIAEYQSSEDVTLREIHSIREAMYAGNGESQQLIKRLQDDGIKIVTITVTEKGYFLNPSDRRLKIDDELIIHDLNNPDTPKTVIGILVAALKKRHQNQQQPFTVLSCDNMPNNGESTQSAVLQFARQADPELADWIASSVKFPSCMVDRIVPAMTESSIAEVNQLLDTSETDHAAIACEIFTQWVIEDNFEQGHPDWQTAGARFVNDVAPYEDMKLRLLNGSHSLLAYLGALGNLATISDCMNQPDYVTLIRQYMMDEAIPTLRLPEGENLSSYVESLIKRFANDSLKHKTTQIAMDGSQKIPQRWLAGTEILLKNNSFPKVTALGIAAWMRYINGVDEQGNCFEVSDPLATDLKKVSEQYLTIDSRVNALLQTPPFMHTTLSSNKIFIEMIIKSYQSLVEIGARKTVQWLVEEN